jgi:hypothetical protein
MCKIGNGTEKVPSGNCNQNIKLNLKHCILSCRLTGGGNDKPEHSFAFWLIIQVTQGENGIFRIIAGDVLVIKLS